MAFSMSGIVVIDKPQGITSHDVVAAVRKKLGTRKVGHAGTLDPMATGVLVIGVNQATRLLDFIVAGIKEYEATVRLGQSTVSDDADGEVVASSDASHLTDAEILAAFSPFKGKISQLPSKVSAKKIDGKRAHELVREGVCFIPRRLPISVRITPFAEFKAIKVSSRASSSPRTVKNTVPSRRSAVKRAAVNVTKPMRGSLIRISTVSATITKILSAIWRARGASAMSHLL